MNKADGSAHQGHYKANSLNTQDSRMRHHEVTIELRKSKKEDQMFMRRNINDENLTSPLKEVNGQSRVQLSVDEIVIAMINRDPERQFLGMQQARKMLSRKRNPPIDLMIGHGIVPICISFLQNTGNTKLQFDSDWALTNIASGTSEQTRCVIEQDAGPHFIALFQSKFTNLAELAAKANTTTSGTPEQIVELIEKNKILKTFIDLLDAKDPRTIKVVQTGLFHLFALAEKMGGTENLCLMLEELGGLDKLEALQLHENEEIYKKAYAIIDTYFNTGDDEAEQKLAPQEVNGAFEFNATHLKAPEGGYSF